MNSFQLHELSTINGMMEEDFLASVRREEVELAGLHGGEEKTRTTRRPSLKRPKLHVRTEQVNSVDSVINLQSI